MMMKEDQKNKIPEDILKQLLSVDPESVYASGYASWQEGDYSRAVIDFS
ncbi:TPA: SycD/LcrH family type III secretion system chaperone SscB, partial [Salmonella enterica subsp. enterica serovar Kentucky]|nr:CesD/SycD/LcrH family type III secretion system chaperone [Salmonella enterica subsp. enterica serovar Kentucky]HBL9555476.1 SycD/LcrH family type III secretion system chaperone SscB [Salmonella enterica subsp. enterica serovar Kentucky]